MTNTPTPLALQHLVELRKAVLWKTEGLDEGDLRRPMTPTGTNLLGLVKHLAACEWGYFGMCFDRPVPDLPHLREGAPRNLDFYATAEETAAQVVQDYRDACTASDRTVTELGLDAVGHVPWWDGREITVAEALEHMLSETARHAGHADIVRELIDGQAGLSAQGSNLTTEDPQEQEDFVEMLRTLSKRAEVGALGAAANADMPTA